MPKPRRFFWLLIVLLILTGAMIALAQAELSLYREELMVTVHYPGGQQESEVIKSWIKGVKMRTDAGGGDDITIIRPDKNLVYNINKKRKEYTESPLSLYRKAAKLSMAMLGADPTYRWTNRKKKIGQWSCREVVVAEEDNEFGQKMKTTWWVSNDTGLDHTLLKQIMKITLGDDMDDATMRFFEKLTAIRGYPVQTESQVSHRGQIIKKIHTLRKLERREIPDSMFELPEGLTKIVVPVPEGLNP